MTDPNGAAIYGAPWIPSIYPLYVRIYTSTMDPMGLVDLIELAAHSALIRLRVLEDWSTWRTHWQKRGKFLAFDIFVRQVQLESPLLLWIRWFILRACIEHIYGPLIVGHQQSLGVTWTRWGSFLHWQQQNRSVSHFAWRVEFPRRSFPRKKFTFFMCRYFLFFLYMFVGSIPKDSAQSWSPRGLAFLLALITPQKNLLEGM